MNNDCNESCGVHTICEWFDMGGFFLDVAGRQADKFECWIHVLFFLVSCTNSFDIRLHKVGGCGTIVEPIVRLGS